MVDIECADLAILEERSSQISVKYKKCKNVSVSGSISNVEEDLIMASEPGLEGGDDEKEA